MEIDAEPDLDDLLRERAAHLRHMAALDRWLDEYQAEHGAFSDEEIARADRLLDESDARLAAKRTTRQPAAKVDDVAAR